MTLPGGLTASPFHPLNPDHVEEWLDVNGYAVPLVVSDPVQEYQAIRRRVGLIDFSMLYKWDIQGPGALDAADRVFSRDLARLKPERIAYGVVTDENGFMIDDCTGYVFAEDYVRIIGGNPLVAELIASVADGGVAVSERRNEFAVMSVQGPRSRELLQRLTTQDMSNDAFPYYSYRRDVNIAGVSAHVNRMGFTAELGYELMVAADDAEELGRVLLEEGQPLGVSLCGAAALMMCRVEAGMIMADLEYDRTTTPFECRMGWSVDLDKDQLLGRNALMEKKDSARSQVVSLVVEGVPDGLDGTPLRAGESEVGHITMAVLSPHLDGATLALARVERDHAEVGTEMAAGERSAPRPAAIVSTPVFDPDRRRVRS